MFDIIGAKKNVAVLKGWNVRTLDKRKVANMVESMTPLKWPKEAEDQCRRVGYRNKKSI